MGCIRGGWGGGGGDWRTRPLGGSAHKPCTPLRVHAHRHASTRTRTHTRAQARAHHSERVFEEEAKLEHGAKGDEQEGEDEGRQHLERRPGQPEGRVQHAHRAQRLAQAALLFEHHGRELGRAREGVGGVGRDLCVCVRQAGRGTQPSPGPYWCFPPPLPPPPPHQQHKGKHVGGKDKGADGLSHNVDCVGGGVGKDGGGDVPGQLAALAGLQVGVQGKERYVGWVGGSVWGGGGGGGGGVRPVLAQPHMLAHTCSHTHTKHPKARAPAASSRAGPHARWPLAPPPPNTHTHAYNHSTTAPPHTRARACCQ